MKCPASFSLKNTIKKSSAAVMISTLRVKLISFASVNSSMNESACLYNGIMRYLIAK